MIKVIKSDDFDLHQIAQSGQCFRLTEEQGRKIFVAVTQNHFVTISLRDNVYEFDCSKNDFQNIWTPYFDLNTNYKILQQHMVSDVFLKAAIEYGGGIRILKQDLWEMIVSFIISQRNNIPRIRNSVETLSEFYGNYLGTCYGRDVYSFPTLDQLKGRDLSVAHLGYREKYIQCLCETMDESLLLQLPLQSTEDAKKILLQFKGVGEKVANCILLFGLHRMDAYPVDVWIQRLIDEVYHGDFNPETYLGYAGYVQQLQFYYYRNHAGLS